ncbi:unnamed protein product [Rotaria magnacalcarata]|uniref:Uncharacterized protein n=3 Tax=Rotaria magnacalcarata TaxID=392030 RepID=A0A815HNH9_9BILA|nr:unnamed protein product [Rotaria magnacalcarata]CAF1659780.1 unnamed protein product [Rotaria magnacalcarata]CAF4142897.1 unnamed protein product [Rotaria magnacalcarata]
MNVTAADDSMVIQVEPKYESEEQSNGERIDGYGIHNFSFIPIKVEPITCSTSSSLSNSMIQSVDGVTYQSKTLNNLSMNNNNRRWKILPKFPSENIDEQASNHLLLTNIPLTELSLLELCRRQHNFSDIVCYENCTHDAITTRDTELLHQLLIELSQQWRVQLPILICNYELMASSMYQLSLEDFVLKLPSFQLTLNEWKFALEFYLQMDVDCFFLKTCSFRESTPRSMDYISYIENEGLFCIDPPEARYGMKPCQDLQCFICHLSPNRISYDLPTVTFTDHQIHKFSNDYQVILNCDVTCSSTNVIYTLTCPCLKYEYIGRTKESFYKRLSDHRFKCLRVMRESILGEHVVHYFGQSSSFNTDKISTYNSMDLYRHIGHCDVALQTFLNLCPTYWCLIPMTNEEADMDDHRCKTVDTSQSHLQTSIHQNLNPYVKQENEIRDDNTTYLCMQYLPRPPQDFRFSKRQHQEQYHFFKNKLDCLPFAQCLDIYSARIVIALPDNCSSELSHFVQALLVTHSESKLNTYTAQIPSHFEHCVDWCRFLCRPSYQ